MRRMKMGLIVGVALAGLGMGACTTTQPSPIAFNYQVDNGQANRIVQVFDLSGNTIVQIRNVDPKTTHFYNERNAEIPHKVVGENVVLSGLQSSFTVSTPLAASRVIRTAPLPAAASVTTAAVESVEAAGAGTPSARAQDSRSEEQLRAEISRIKREISELKRLIAAGEVPTNGPAAGTSTALASPAAASSPEARVANAEMAQGEVIRVNFKDRSQRFAPPRQLRDQILDQARKAKAIEIRGFTDAAQVTPSSEALAKGRADAARRFLVRKGIEQSKIRVEYEAAGRFISDNNTDEGKAANRRVEIRTS